MNLDHRAVLALGANLGDAAHALQSAVDQLRADPRTRVTAVSSVYATAPVGGPPQPDYVNAAVALVTDRDADELLELAHEIEQAHGRVRDVVWGPRTLDVDVVVFDALVTDDPRLTLPHPRAHLRAFVLQPWLDVDPEAVHPVHGPVRALLIGVQDQRVQALPEVRLQ